MSLRIPRGGGLLAMTPFRGRLLQLPPFYVFDDGINGIRYAREKAGDPVFDQNLT
jgi:hypothetical protein